MRALIVFESMYGNTHVVADHVADGLRSSFETTVVPVDDATPELVRASDLLVCGGPTHAHGLSRVSTRNAAVAAAEKDGTLSVEAAAQGLGLREWFEGIGRQGNTAAAAFDTRIDAPAFLTGRASTGIARRLRWRGFRLAVEPESFLVDKHNHLLEGEAERAASWGAALAAAVGPTTTPTAPAPSSSS
jgi:hypothetical protein